MSGSLWPVNPTKRTLPCRFARSSASMTPPRAKWAIRIVVVGALVDLPEIETVRLQPAQGLVELPHGDLGVASMRADLRHQEHLVAASLERAPHPLLALVLVVLPRVVEEGDARVDGGVDDADRLARRADRSEVISAESEQRDLLIRVAAEGAERNHAFRL